MVRRLLSALVVVCAMIPYAAFGQSFENTTAVFVNGGFTFPFGGGASSWGPGVLGEVHAWFPFTPTISGGIRVGITNPSSDEDKRTLLTFPFQALLIFPLAPEAGATPYLEFGIGATHDKVTYDDELKPGIEDCSDTYLTHSVKLGYAMRPESMRNTIFDLGIRYMQQNIQNQSDWRNFDITIGVGLCF